MSEAPILRSQKKKKLIKYKKVEVKIRGETNEVKKQKNNREHQLTKAVF